MARYQFENGNFNNKKNTNNIHSDNTTTDNRNVKFGEIIQRSQIREKKSQKF